MFQCPYCLNPQYNPHHPPMTSKETERHTTDPYHFRYNPEEEPHSFKNMAITFREDLLLDLHLPINLIPQNTSHIVSISIKMVLMKTNMILTKEQL